MRIVIGVTPDDSGDDALALGAMACNTFNATPVLVHIYPAAYEFASMGHIDAEWHAYLAGEAQSVVDEAAADFEKDYGFADVRTLIHGHRSSGVGLTEVAAANNADVIVIGSAPGGSRGRFEIGSTADQLLHGSHVPVGLAPAGFRRTYDETFSRLVVAFQQTKESHNALAEGARMARVRSLPLTTVTVLQRHRMYGSKLGDSAEDVVLAQLRDDAIAEQGKVLEGLPGNLDVSAEVAIADTITGALQQLKWNGSELLVLSSARGGAIRRVFLGDMTYKLVKAAPVPTVVLPRRTQE